MTFYIINKITNKINPDLITGDIALFETEQDYINAKQQWVRDNTIVNELSAFDENGSFINIAPEFSILQQNLATSPLTYTDEILDEAPAGFELNQDNTLYIELPNPQNTKYIQTILPNEADYQYILATETEIQNHIQDYINFLVSNESRESIVATHKNYLDIEHTHRFDIKTYIEGKVRDQLGIQEYMYIETTDELLNQFLINESNEKIELVKQEIETAYSKGKQKIEDIYNEMTDKNNTILLVNGVKMSASSLMECLEIVDNKVKSKLETVDFFDETRFLRYNVSMETVIKQGATLSKILEAIKVKYNNLYTELNTIYLGAKLIENVLKTRYLTTEEIATYSQIPKMLDDFIATLNKKLLDGDEIKDGFITIVINDELIKVYDNNENIDITGNVPKIMELLEKSKLLK